MMASQETAQANLSTLRSPGFKLLLIILLTIATAAPLLLIELALTGRQGRASDAAQDIATGWGGAQTIAGPMLFVPYEVTVENVVDGKTVQSTSRSTAVLLPSTLNLDTSADTQTRWRGIFPVPVYRAAVSLRAQFDKADIAGLAPDGARMLWEQAYIGILVSDVRGLAGNIALQANARKVGFEPGIGIDGISAQGIHAPLALAGPPDGLTLAADFAVRGSRELSFASLGRQTTAHLKSGWPDPSFFGVFLPSEHRIGKSGFDAAWTVPYLARGYGQSFQTAESALTTVQNNANFGVRFYQPVDFYQLVERSLKYAVLFVGLAFLIFFVAELISGRRLHGAQYTMIGAAQVLFYLLLLSFAEHIGFTAAYLLAGAATVLLTTLYAASAFASWRKAAGLGAVLTALYGLLYLILQQEDYALLIGALVLFCALAATMFTTRRVEWSRIIPQAVP
jgi:inner membrane protein